MATINNIKVGNTNYHIDTAYIDLADSGATKTSTSGTITNEQLTILQASKQNCIIFDNQIYRLQDNEHNSGILTYTYNGYDTEIVSKTITITISTLGWTLTELSASGGGTNVEANNGETTSATLNTLKVGETNYAVPSGGGSGVQTLTGTAFFDPPITFSGIIGDPGFLYSQLNDKILNIENVEITLSFQPTEEFTLTLIAKYDYITDNLVCRAEGEIDDFPTLIAIPFVHNDIQYLMLIDGPAYLSDESDTFTTNDTEIEIIKYMVKHLSIKADHKIDSSSHTYVDCIFSLVQTPSDYKLNLFGIGHSYNRLHIFNIICFNDENEISINRREYTLIPEN